MAGPVAVGEAFDGVGDGLLGGEDLGGGVGLLAGAGDTDERHDRPAGDDVVDDPVELGGVAAVEAWGDARRSRWVRVNTLWSASSRPSMSSTSAASGVDLARR